MRKTTRLCWVALALAVFAPLAQGSAGANSWIWSTTNGPTAPDSAERTVSVRVRVEAGLTVEPDEIASIAGEILADERGWLTLEKVAFELVTNTDNPDLLVTVASPATTDRLCLPLNTVGRLSCRRGGQIILNVDRWSRGPDVYHDEYDGNIDEYRRYLVNHEVGHFLGKGHVFPSNCAADIRAPVMMQQTFGLKGCAVNGWPTLDNTTVEPFAEQVASLAAAFQEKPLLVAPWRFTRSPLRR